MVAVSTILSLGIVLFLGYILNFFLNKIKIPGIVGLIILGFVLGSSLLNLISTGLQNISPDLRTIALIIVLTRTGLNLDLESLKKLGRPVILLSFIPAIFEIIGVTFSSLWLLGFDIYESMLLASVLTAVSPAIISVRMINLIEKRFGEEHQVPKLILVGSSVDDIFVIILFNAFLSLAKKSSFNATSIIAIPISLIFGVIFGILIGILFFLFESHTNLNVIDNTLIYFSLTLLMKGLENIIEDESDGKKVDYLNVSSLLSIIIVGIILLWKLPDKSKELSKSYNSFWKFFEIILFILVGAVMKFNEELKSNIGYGIAIIFIGIACRSIGVQLAVIKTKYTFKERIFIMLSYMSKATVQASIGGIPLARNLKCGNLILSLSAVSIIICATIGALCIDLLGPAFLQQTKEDGIDKEGKKIQLEIKEEGGKSQEKEEAQKMDNSLN